MRKYIVYIIIICAISEVYAFSMQDYAFGKVDIDFNKGDFVITKEKWSFDCPRPFYDTLSIGTYRFVNDCIIQLNSIDISAPLWDGKGISQKHLTVEDTSKDSICVVLNFIDRNSYIVKVIGQDGINKEFIYSSINQGFKIPITNSENYFLLIKISPYFDCNNPFAGNLDEISFYGLTNITIPVILNMGKTNYCIISIPNLAQVFQWIYLKGEYMIVDGDYVIWHDRRYPINNQGL